MKRRLILMRHAHSAWPDGEGGQDRQRPLDVRGRREAQEQAATLAARGWLPERALVSTARRALETWERMEGAFGAPVDLFEDDALYEEGFEAARSLLAEAPPPVSTQMVVGHNPDLSTLGAWLTREQAALRPGAAALLHADGLSWADLLQPGRWTLLAVLDPR